MSNNNILIGKLFAGVADGCMRSGIIEAAISDNYFLVRFDDLDEPSGLVPASLMVVNITTLAGGGGGDEPFAWQLFDNQEQRAAFQEWANTPEDNRKPSLVPLRPKK
jgi:hypothetical protein